MHVRRPPAGIASLPRAAPVQAERRGADRAGCPPAAGAAQVFE